MENMLFCADDLPLPSSPSPGFPLHMLSHRIRRPKPYCTSIVLYTPINHPPQRPSLPPPNSHTPPNPHSPKKHPKSHLTSQSPHPSFHSDRKSVV